MSKSTVPTVCSLPSTVAGLVSTTGSGRARSAGAGLRCRRSRGSLMLGVAAIVALLGFLAYAANTAALSNYRTAARLRQRLAAVQLARGGIATAQSRLAEDPDWTGETWDAPGVGSVEIRILKLENAGERRVQAIASIPNRQHPQQVSTLQGIVIVEPSDSAPAIRHLRWQSGSSTASGEARP